MPRRQTLPRQWLIVAAPSGVAAVRSLPRGAGVLLVVPLPASQMRRLRVEARRRDLTVVEEAPGAAARVHNVRELRRALLTRAPLILLSPVHPTRSHPDWRPIPRMRAAALARLARRKLIALGGMDARNFARIRRLGFQAWAGISAFRT